MLSFLRMVAPVFYPVGLAWLAALALGVVALRRGHRAIGASLIGSALALTLIIQPAVLEGWFARTERPWIEFTVGRAPNADAIVVLGGGWRVSPHDQHDLDFTPAGDRLFAGIELCRLKRAPVLVLGGDLPFQPPGYALDSEQIRKLLLDWGLAPSEVLSLGTVSNTRDEAAQTLRLVRERGWKRVLLVTSAFHMERAQRTFVAAGVPVHPVACDFQTHRVPAASFPNNIRLCPRAEDLNTLTLWWHETLGGLAYRLAGAG